MLRKIVLTVVIGSLLAGGLFYILENTDSSQKEIAGEWPERSSEKIVETVSSEEPQGVLGEEVDQSAEAPQDLPDPVREFVGCRENQLNINRAPLKDLEVLAGIGPVIGQRIIEERQNGLFYSLSDLMRVQGIGEKTVQSNL